MLDYLRSVDPLTRPHRESIKDGASAPKVISIDAPFGDIAEGFQIPCEGDQRLIDAEIITATLLRGCSARVNLVLYHYFVLEWKQGEIGAMLGVTEGRVSHIISRSLEKMRAAAESPPLPS